MTDKRFFTAQVRASTAIVESVSATPELLSAPAGWLFIPLETYDESLHGKLWNGSAFVDAPKTPNNQNNPYFGKAPLIPKDFWGLVLQVFIAGQGSNAGGLDRLSRLMDSKRAQPVIKIIDSVSTIDPDDKAGAFLRMTSLLTSTDHEGDGQRLMTSQELAAIMAAWE